MMRPSTPNHNFSQQAGPSSPPETPTTSTFTFKNARHGVQNLSRPTPQNGILPNGQGPQRYNPPAGLADLSPRSSSPSSDSSGSPPRSLSSDPGEPISESPPRAQTRVVEEHAANFTVEEFGESDYDEFDSNDEENIIRPHQYEDAESDQAHSAMGSEIDSRILSDFRNLGCGEQDLLADREAWLEAKRAEKRRKRRSSGSVKKRTLSQSIGSDSDDEDLQPVQLDANEAGSSARRLRRKLAGDRTSLTFEDPPPIIPEIEEPESCEEVVEQGNVEDAQGVDRELPYYVQDMEVDSGEE